MKILNTIKIYSSALILFLISYNISFASGTNKSFVFNGSTSSIKILDGAPVNTDANQSAFKYFNSTTSSSSKKITIDTWVYLLGDNAGVEMPVIIRSVSGGSSFNMYVKDGTAYFSVGNSIPVSTAITFPSFPAFRWIRLTGTYDGITLKIYYNGVLAESRSQSLGPIYTTGEGLFIGKYEDNTFNGLIDEVRIFNRALTSSQINSCNGGGDPSSSIPSSLSSYLVGRWSFTETTTFNGTTTLKDLSSKKNHLRLTDIDEIVKSNPLPFFVVNSTGDGSDICLGDEFADAGNGLVTLRSAIQEANALANLQKIYFYLPQTQPFMIQPLSTLPAISGPVILDGTFQRGYNGSPLVEINGTYGGLTLTSGGSTVKGLNINTSSGFGLTISSAGGNNISKNVISGILISSQGNNINANSISNPNGDGISIISGGLNNQIGVLESNNISGNSGHGISIENAGGNQISNNIIGTNNLDGISFSNCAGNAFGNTINANTGFGISVSGGTGNQILNNIIGTNIAGGLSISDIGGNISGNTITGNLSFGISFTSANSNILTGNEISGNTSYGVVIESGSGNAIENNTIFNNGSSVLQ